MFIIGSLASNPAFSATSPAQAADEKQRGSTALSEAEGKKLRQKVDRLAGTVERMEAEMEVLRAQHTMMIHRTNLAYTDQFYLKGGVSLIMPRSRTFTFRTDSGIGAFVGMGQYFGKNHVGDLSFDWDLYPAISLRYRFEIHSEAPLVSWGPVIGVKLKMATLKPIDNFLDKPEDVKSLFMMFGGMLGFPMGRSLVTLEFLYLTNTQAALFMNAGIHFFL